MIRVNIGIEEPNRKQVAEGLAQILADTYTLYLKAHNFHWNVRGPMFQTLHQMFERQYQELALAVDTIAERIRALGYSAPGSYREFGQLTTMKESIGMTSARDMIQALLDGNEIIGRTCRQMFPIADRASDEATADLLTERMEYHEKTAWMLRSLLED
ncbi:MAG: DNA starvation/stationary phase protection protein [Bdellovibrio sp.]|nr:MAG: DNA starvation/stationary phase protection protein [Bdellovibrio sp.]